MFPRRNCDGERLTETLTLSDQEAQASQARRRTHAPNSSMSPISSTIGMNSPGETAPRTGWRQRASASNETILRDLTSTIGWKWTSIASLATAMRSSSSTSRRTWILVSISRSKTRQLRLPSALAA